MEARLPVPQWVGNSPSSTQSLLGAPQPPPSLPSRVLGREGAVRSCLSGNLLCGLPSWWPSPPLKWVNTMFPPPSVQTGAFLGAPRQPATAIVLCRREPLTTRSMPSSQHKYFSGHNTLFRGPQVARPCHQAHPRSLSLLPALVGRRGQEKGRTRECPKRSGPLWPIVLSLGDKERPGLSLVSCLGSVNKSEPSSSHSVGAEGSAGCPTRQVLSRACRFGEIVSLARSHGIPPPPLPFVAFLCAGPWGTEGAFVGPIQARPAPVVKHRPC